MSRNLKVKIANPVRPGGNLTSAARAGRFVRQGRAVYIDEHTIQFVEQDRRHQNAATVAAHDAWGRELLHAGAKLDWRGEKAVNVSILRGGFRPGEVRS